MRYSLAIGLASAAVALAGPLQTRQNKLPFFQHRLDCWNGPALQPPNASEYSEACQGTVDYCTNEYYKRNGESYNSSTACFEAREPPPFTQPYDIWVCKNSQTKMKQEFCLGTSKFCNQKQYEGTIETYNSPQECIAARGEERPKPAHIGVPVWTKRPTKAELPANTELPTEAEACQPFGGNSTACYTTMGDLTECLGKGKDTAQDAIIKCVLDIAASSLDTPTEHELCPPFDGFGGAEACTATLKECFDKHETKVDRIKCVHAVATTPTKEELCPPFNGNMTACDAATTACSDKHKGRRQAIIKCVHAAATAGPLQTSQNKIPFLTPWGDCAPSDTPTAFGNSEDCVGTLTFCTKEIYKHQGGKEYDSPKACLAAREPPPFQERAKNYNTCSKKSSDDAKKESCRGTEEFCNYKLYKGTIESYDSPEQCINARRGAPKPGSKSPTKAKLARRGGGQACPRATYRARATYRGRALPTIR
ncbi:hypothetical protein MHUMG1_02279 [Metarhizium humberi]|uniref:Uncharacterized protein n=1 Tax=Metarhizium humberi TaxID=2596975 RepID=A0A9P8S994_9HYPO|nr:hypothetical protein MHUMG1_02279 [Metarhizium humberi]